MELEGCAYRGFNAAACLVEGNPSLGPTASRTGAIATFGLKW